MRVSEIVDKIGLEVVTGGNALDNEVNFGYVSDLLSDVIANARKGSIWITLQVHPNIVAVASMKSLSGIIIVNNRNPEKETITRAEDEGIPILKSKLTAYEVAGRLWVLGIRNSGDDDG